MPNITLDIDADSALIMFEWLSNRFEAEHVQTSDFAAEDMALANLLASLEALLTEPFSTDYADRLEAARRRLTAAP